ncbi:MAG: hypothetical protein WC362_05580 [Methanoregula sp.]|jgi:uncharacterized BrkB/YihY/UPF0761 family membrane protein
MTGCHWFERMRQSNWFLFLGSLIVTVAICILIEISMLTKFYQLSLALFPLLVVSSVCIIIGLFQGFIGKEQMSPTIHLIIGLISLTVLTMGFFWAISTVPVSETTSWMKDGTTTIFAGIAGAMAYDIITKFPK